MESRTVKLVEGTDWVEIRPLPLSERLGQVEEGTLWAAGDVVERPEWLSWEEAAEPTVSGDTVLSPMRLKLAYDAVAEFGILPEACERDAARGEGEDRDAVGSLDRDAEFAREVSRALAEPLEARPGKERRRSRRAA